MILADPQLREWPHRGPTSNCESGATQLPSATVVAPRTDNTVTPTAPPPAPHQETPPATITGAAAPSEPAAAAPNMSLLTGTAASNAADRGALTAQDRDDTYYPPRDNSAADAEENTDDVDDSAASNSGSTPLTFDEITRPRRHLRGAFTRPTEWVKENWRRPQVLGSAAAAVVAAVTVTVWAAASSEPAPQPTATLTAPSAAAAPPASTPIADGPIPVKSASARCPAPSSDPMGAVRPDSTQPWICVRAWGIDGQVLTLTLDGPYVITAVRIMPGVNAESDGQDQWLRYRTLTRVAWSFNDAGRTKIVQSTENRRELLTETVAPADCASAGCSVVATQVALTVEKTTAPAAAPTALGISPAGGGIGTDAATAFGVSRIEIIGHRAS